MKRLQRVKPWIDPNDAVARAVTAAEEMARREAAAAAAADALLNVRYGCALAQIRVLRSVDMSRKK